MIDAKGRVAFDRHDLERVLEFQQTLRTASGKTCNCGCLKFILHSHLPSARTTNPSTNVRTISRMNRRLRRAAWAMLCRTSSRAATASAKLFPSARPSSSARGAAKAWRCGREVESTRGGVPVGQGGPCTTAPSLAPEIHEVVEESSSAGSVTVVHIDGQPFQRLPTSGQAPLGICPVYRHPSAAFVGTAQEGLMLWLRWKRLSGSYLAFTAASRL